MTKSNMFKKVDDKWMLCDQTGKVLKRFGAIDAVPLLSVLVVHQGDYYGLIDLSGEYMQPCKYLNISQPFFPGIDECDEYYEVLQLEDADHLLWLADKNGIIVTSRGYTEISSQDWRGIVDTHGSWNHVTNTYYEYYAPMDLKHKIVCCGLFDLQNVREIIPAIYSPGAPHCLKTDGISAYGIPIYDELNGEKRCKLIDADGKDVIPFEAGYSEIENTYDYHLRWHEEYLLYAKKDGKYGYINIENVVKIPFKYDDAGEFVNGYAIVGYGDKTQCYGAEGLVYGVIDRHGKTVIPFRYSDISKVGPIDGHIIVEARLKCKDKYKFYDENNVEQDHVELMP